MSNYLSHRKIISSVITTVGKRNEWRNNKDRVARYRMFLSEPYKSKLMMMLMMIELHIWMWSCHRSCTRCNWKLITSLSFYLWNRNVFYYLFDEKLYWQVISWHLRCHSWWHLDGIDSISSIWQVISSLYMFFLLLLPIYDHSRWKLVLSC